MAHFAPEKSKPLTETEAGQHVRIIKVSDESASVLNYLGERGLMPGRVLVVKEVRTLDGVVAVEDKGGGEHSLEEALTRAIFVQTVAEPA
jgi:DtxR family transcriptional regulator, Mn-dependent transcriptional regulator